MTLQSDYESQTILTQLKEALAWSRGAHRDMLNYFNCQFINALFIFYLQLFAIFDNLVVSFLKLFFDSPDTNELLKYLLRNEENWQFFNYFFWNSSHVRSEAPLLLQMEDETDSKRSLCHDQQKLIDKHEFDNRYSWIIVNLFISSTLISAYTVYSMFFVEQPALGSSHQRIHSYLDNASVGETVGT